MEVFLLDRITLYGTSGWLHRDGARPREFSGRIVETHPHNPIMDIQIATLCDHAADYNGKLVITGTFDTLAARALPVVHPSCALALRFCFTLSGSLFKPLRGHFLIFFYVTRDRAKVGNVSDIVLRYCMPTLSRCFPFFHDTSN